MRVLVACEYSGRVRDAFIRRGHDAISCDLLPSESDFGPHVQGDVCEMLDMRWDLVVAFPPCTDLSAANGGLLKIKEADGRMDIAADFFLRCFDANAPRVCVENPVGVIPRYFRKADQIINPWQFGDPYTKKTCLWLRGLPKLEATHKWEDYDPEPIAWHHGSGVRKNGVRTFGNHAKAYGAKKRSETFLGIADAMAGQWSESSVS